MTLSRQFFERLDGEHHGACFLLGTRWMFRHLRPEFPGLVLMMIVSLAHDIFLWKAANCQFTTVSLKSG